MAFCKGSKGILKFFVRALKVSTDSCRVLKGSYRFLLRVLKHSSLVRVLKGSWGFVQGLYRGFLGLFAMARKGSLGWHSSPENRATGHDAPKGSVLADAHDAWALGCSGFPADAHDAWALGRTQFPQNRAAAHDAPQGSGLSRLMLMMLGPWGDKVARASRLMLMTLGLGGERSSRKTGPPPMMLRKARGCPG